MNPLITLPILMSSIMCLLTKEWVILWTMMEINTASFMYNLINQNKKAKMSTMFIFQALSSCGMLVAILSPQSNWMISHQINTSLIILISMIMKMGMFPFISWIMIMTKEMSWNNNLILMTWQKIIPMIVILKMNFQKSIWWAITLPMTMTAMMMCSMTEAKKIMMSSSLIHTSWMMMPAMKSIMSPVSYLFIYSIILIKTIQLVKKTSTTIPIKSLEKSNSTKISISLLSLGGLPPLMGFIPKWMVFFHLSKTTTPLWMIIKLIMITSMSIYVYTQIMYKNFSFKTNSTNKKMIKSKKTNKWELFTPTLMIFI